MNDTYLYIFLFLYNKRKEQQAVYLLKGAAAAVYLYYSIALHDVHKYRERKGLRGFTNYKKRWLLH